MYNLFNFFSRMLLPNRLNAIYIYNLIHKILNFFFRFDSTLQLKWVVKCCKWEQWTQLWFYTLDCVPCQKFASFLPHTELDRFSSRWLMSARRFSFFGNDTWNCLKKQLNSRVECQKHWRRKENLIDVLATYKIALFSREHALFNYSLASFHSTHSNARHSAESF